MESRYIKYKHSDIHYRKTGNGKDVTVCFHGFGEYAKTFDILSGSLKNHCFIAIDLPFHGETHWQEGLEFTAEELLTIIRQIPEVANNRFGLLGYSMGGRICLSILQAFPGLVTYIVLLAPDGLKINIWYRFATQTFIGERLFMYTMKSPGWFYTLLNAAKMTGLVNQSILKFVHRYLDDTQMREKVYNTWITLRSFRPDLSEVKNDIRQFFIPVRLIYGRYDRIILPGPGLRFLRGIEKYSSITLVDTGHQVLHIRNLTAIRLALNECIQLNRVQA